MSSPTTPDPDASADPSVEGQMLTLRSRFADRLAAAEWERVREVIVRQRQNAAAVRAVPLRNGDEPATVFAPISPTTPEIDRG